MSTMFSSVEEAKATVAAISGTDPTTFEEVPDLHVGGLETMLLEDPKTDEATKQQIRDRIAAQQGFKFTDPDGNEIKIVFAAGLTVGLSDRTAWPCGCSHQNQDQTPSPEITSKGSYY